jgi:ABC-type multidrug transport system fused ATPase/permease subunit
LRFEEFFRSKITLSILGIIAIIIAANGLYLTNTLQNNPFNQRAGLTVSQKPPLTTGYNTIDPNDGFTAQALGHAAAEQWLSGHVPYWNHYEGVGAPLAGEMQSAAFFLPLVLLLHFSNGLLYMHICLEIIAGISTYLFLRRLKLSHAAAFTGGVAFALSAAFVWLTNAVVNPVAFLPMLFLGVEMISSKSTKAKKKSQRFESDFPGQANERANEPKKHKSTKAQNISRGSRKEKRVGERTKEAQKQKNDKN